MTKTYEQEYGPVTTTETCRIHPEETQWGGCLECPTCTDCGHYFIDMITDRCSNCGRKDD